MKIDINKINEYKEKGLLSIQKHPTLDIFIAKYSNECVYSEAWDELTLTCRSLWFDSVGNVLANPIPKFHNHSDKFGSVIYAERKNTPYVITEKLDGSYIVAAKVNGEIVVSSSGSFTSAQAIKAMEMIAKYNDFIEDGKTYLFEIIYPGNRIVLDYADLSSLTLLAIRDTGTGAEFPLDTRFECVKTVDKTLEEIEAELPQKTFINKEGWVVRFADGSRVKMKLDEYMRIHKIISGVNSVWVWECLRDGVDMEKTLDNVPDELYDFVKTTKEKLMDEYEVIEREATVGHLLALPFSTRKDQAQFIINNYKNYSGIIFAMLDKKDYSSNIWKMLKPENVKTFGRGDA